jgi:hypothetical protein
VSLRDVCGFVRQHRSEFGLVLGGQNQAGVHADETTGHGEGVDGRIVDDEKSEVLLRIVAARHQPLAQRLDVFADLRIVHEGQRAARLAH